MNPTLHPRPPRGHAARVMQSERRQQLGAQSFVVYANLRFFAGLLRLVALSGALAPLLALPPRGSC